MLVRAAALALVTTIALPAFANGVISEFPAGGVVFKQAANIAIEREDLYLSLREIRVRYEYRSDAATTETHTIGFPMPPVPLEGSPDYLGGVDVSALADPRNYMNFVVKVNGTPVAARLHEYAIFEGKDITAELMAAGLPVFLPSEAKEEALGKLDPAVLKQLAGRGLFYEGEELAYWEPLWQYQTIYEWSQDFAPGKTEVEISYVPLNGYPSDFGQVYEGGGEYDDPAHVAEVKAEYCIDDSLVSAVKRRAESGYYEVVTQGYITTTGNYWKGPIGEFNLIVDKHDTGEGMSDADLVAFCPLEARKISDTQFKWTARDYEPERDIRVLYYAFQPDP